MKKELSSTRVLRILTIKTPFNLHTDVSRKAVGDKLGQLDEQGVEQPLTFASQKLSETQMGWSTIEWEAYAVIWALNRFRDLIYESHFL